MQNLFNIDYDKSRKSKNTNNFGMREMQVKAYEARLSQYILIKAPPASGKSRALMYIALDKLENQGIKKVIVAVPEKTIGASFAPIELSKNGFFKDWTLPPQNNLCSTVKGTSKVLALINFLSSNDSILICTHATLRTAINQIDITKLNNTLLAIDEFHHISPDVDNRLGEILKNVMNFSSAHIIAMTGSFFRGDKVPVLMPEYEARFHEITYTYSQQLAGYQHLKSLGIGFHFYSGRYFEKQPGKELSALAEVLDESKKTIVYIPAITSAESSRRKKEEVDQIIAALGVFIAQSETTGVLDVRSSQTGRILKVADLVNDQSGPRRKISNYLNLKQSGSELDIIIALGKAKEGFDWPYCEHVLTIGHRGSLTEVIQIIGRVTRDSPTKSHAQFTNLIAQPDVEQGLANISVNNMFKALAASLLMEQVLAPSYKFKNKIEKGQQQNATNVCYIEGLESSSSQRVKNIIETGLDDLKARILQDDTVFRETWSGSSPELINKILIPKIIRNTYPDLESNEIEVLRQHVVADTLLKSGRESGSNKKGKNSPFIKTAGEFLNINDLHINLIDSINPFQHAFEILSKSLNLGVLNVIQDQLKLQKIKMSEEEAVFLWPSVKLWVDKTNNDPDINSNDPREKKLAEAVVFLKNLEQIKIQNGLNLTLQTIFHDSDFKSLGFEPKVFSPPTVNDPVVNSFLSINEFIYEHGREPQETIIDELQLFSNLNEIKKDVTLHPKLRPYDKYNLLASIEAEIPTIDSIFNDRKFKDMKPDYDTSILNLKNKPVNTTRAPADFVSKRKHLTSNEFSKYKVHFDAVRKEIIEGKRHFETFQNPDLNLKAGNFYVLENLILFLEKVNLSPGSKNLKSGKRIRTDGRTSIIFENGTSSDMLFRSLGKALLKNGRLITPIKEGRDE